MEGLPWGLGTGLQNGWQSKESKKVVVVRKKKEQKTKCFANDLAPKWISINDPPH